MNSYPTLHRSTTDRLLAGVASGLAEHLHVPVAAVRVFFLVTMLLGGVGAFIYVLLWVVSTPAPTGPPQKVSHRFFWRMLTLLAVVVSGSFMGLAGGIGMGIVPFVVVLLGAALVWAAYGKDSDYSVAFIGGGAALVFTGIVIVGLNWENQKVIGSTIVAVAVTLLGVAALGVPLWLRLWNSLIDERTERAAQAERAEIASRLHDSVLQTLALIQKRADDPATVVKLARGQERQLRAWLFDAPVTDTTTFVGVTTAAGEVEDLYGKRIEVVTVGEDLDMIESIVAASREAMVNAAKHAQVDTIDVYVEHFGDELAIYIRDRGVGFDPDAVSADRQGIANSIRARMEQAGGEAIIKTAPGRGTEVQLILGLNA